MIEVAPTMSELLQTKQPSLFEFARAHVLATIFGVVMPLAVFAVFVGYPSSTPSFSAFMNGTA